MLNIFKWALQIAILIGLSGSSLERPPNFNALPDMTIPGSQNSDADISSAFSLSDLFLRNVEKSELNGELETSDQEEIYTGCNGNLSEMNQALVKLPFPVAL